MSGLLSSSAFYQQDMIKLIEDSQARQKYFVIIGGGAASPEWVVEIKADGYGRIGDDAAELCNRLHELKEKPPLKKPIIIGV